MVGGVGGSALAQVPGVVAADVPAGEVALREIATAYERGVSARETERAEKIKAAWADLDGHLGAAKAPDADVRKRDNELSEASRLLVELDVLMGPGGRGALEGDGRFESTVGTVAAAAREAEARGDWLLASEMFVRLDALFDVDKRYEGDVDRLNDRLSMIRLYAPERLWALTNERRLLRGAEPLPAYNPFGDTYQEKLAAVTEDMILRSVHRAATGHVERAGIASMLLDGLGSIETFATTTDLHAVFPGLRDEGKRAGLLGGLDALRGRIEERADRVGVSDIKFTIEQLMRINRETAGVMETALLHEFGNGALSGLDRYTAVIWPDEIKRFERSTRGQFTGVGIQIEMDELFNIKVVTPLPGSPAQRAGIGAGDIITRVNGRSTVGFTLDQAVEVITGPEGTTVDVTLERGADPESRDERTYTLRRTAIDLPTVKGWKKTGPGDSDWDWYIDRGARIGYVRITQFSEKTTEEFDAAIAVLRGEGLEGLILDLRFNPGGLLDQAVSISNRFVDDGLIVKTEDRDGNVVSREYARRIPPARSLRDLPVAVLVNEGSASASEIVSGAIQAYAHEGKLDAWVVGENSFGKGSVQQVFPLDFRGQAMMKLTTQYYKLRDDRIIHRLAGSESWGVEPDIRVEMLTDRVVEAVTIRRDADILELDGEGQVVAKEDRPDPQTLIRDGVDLQLQAALVKIHAERAGVKVSVLDGPGVEVGVGVGRAPVP